MLEPSEKEKILLELKEFLKLNYGLSFCLVMRQEDGGLELFKRINQPCWGELRKYKATHGFQCTKPEDRRPNDLYDPFPSGTPEALACSLSSTIIGENYLNFLWSDKSPWVSGFGAKSNIIRSEKGVILLDTAVDPTVLVSLLKNSKMASCAGPLFNTLTGSGLTPMQSIFPCIFTGLANVYPTPPKIPGPDTYINAVTVDVERVFNQNPQDLTGGTLRNRYDYERKGLARLFHSSTGLNFAKELNKQVEWHKFQDKINYKQGWKGIKLDSIVTSTLKILQDYFVSKARAKTLTSQYTSTIDTVAHYEL